MTKLTVVRDTREKTGFWEFSVTETCAGVIDKKLDTGDYSIEGLEHLLCIERKRNLSEFSINSSEVRFAKELKRMEDYKYRYIICEFSIDDILKFPIGTDIPKSKWKLIKISPKFMMRRISEIQVNHGIHVIFAGCTDNAKYAAMNIMKRVFEKHGKEIKT